jgi:uncharacterized membrane protein
MTWLGFSFLCALFSGFRDFFAKRSSKIATSSTISFVQYFIGAIVISLIAYSDGIPEIQPSFYLSVLSASILVCFGTLSFFYAIELSDVSLMVPLRSLTLPILLLLAPLLLNEEISLGGCIGVLVLTFGLFIGSYSRSITSFFGLYKEAAGTKHMLFAVILFSISALIEKIGVQSSSALFFFAFESCLVCFFIGCVLFVKKKLNVRTVCTQLPTLLPIGICFSFMFIAQGLALASGPVTYVIALKRSGIVLTVILGSLILKEQSGLQRFLGSIVVFIGAAIISLN